MKNSTWLTLAILAIASISAYAFYDNKQKENFQKAQEDNLKYTRNNWNSYVSIKKTQYEFSTLGGISAFDVPVQNNTDYLIDEVIVSIEYVKTSGGVYKTENVVITNIPPHSSKTGRAPESPRGTSIRANITEAISRSLHLCYPSGSRAFDDPYFCQ